MATSREHADSIKEQAAKLMERAERLVYHPELHGLSLIDARQWLKRADYELLELLEELGVN